MKKNPPGIYSREPRKGDEMAKLLIADDDPEILRFLDKILTLEGHTVKTAKDGEEAVEMAKKDNFDIIITDIIMPRKEGIETIIELREMNPDIKIIAISGGGRKGRMDFLRMAEMVGASEILAKPFQPQELLEKINNCLK